MSFSPSFQVGQSAASPANVTFTDDSTGSDVLILSRRIYVTDNNGNPVVPTGYSTTYIDWAIGTNPLTVAALLQVDTAVNVLVQWLGAANAVLYEDNEDFCLREFNIQQFIYLIQNQALIPGIVQDANYFTNLCIYWINIQGANTMVVDAADLSGSQNCLNRATEMLQNESKYF